MGLASIMQKRQKKYKTKVNWWFFSVFKVIDQIIIIIKKDMGCGAVCGNNSSIYEPNKF